MFVFLLLVSLIAFSKVINNEPGPSYLFLFVCSFFLLSLYRNQRDFQESLPLNVLNVDARLEFALENGTGIESLHSEPRVQQEGAYTELFPESMMVIILIKLLNISPIKKGNIVCVLLPFLKLFSCSSRCLLSASPLSLRLYIAALRHLECGILTKKFSYQISLIVLSIYHYYSSNFIHPFMSLLFLTSILNITCLIKTLWNGG